MRTSRKKWTTAERVTLIESLEASLPLSSISEKLINRTSDAIVRQACIFGYGVKSYEDDKIFKPDIKRRNGKKLFKDEAQQDGSMNNHIKIIHSFDDKTVEYITSISNYAKTYFNSIGVAYTSGNLMSFTKNVIDMKRIKLMETDNEI